MLRYLFLILLFSCLQQQVAAQYFVQLSNGKTIECKDYTITDPEIRLKSADGKKTDVSIDSVLRIHSIEDEEVVVLRKIKKGDNSLARRRYYPLKVVQDGAVRLLEDVIVGTKVGLPRGDPRDPRTEMRRKVTTTVHTYYYIDSQDTLVWYYERPGNDKKKIKAALKKVFADNESMVKKLDRTPLTVNNNEALRFVREYNLSKWSAPNQEGPKAAVNFYINVKGPRTVKITVNDSTEYDVSSTSFTPIELPIKGPTKVCVKGNCDIVLPSPYITGYVRLDSYATKFESVYAEDAKEWMEGNTKKSRK